MAKQWPQELATFCEVVGSICQFGGFAVNFGQKFALLAREGFKRSSDACPEFGIIGRGSHAIEDTFGLMSSDVARNHANNLVQAFAASAPTYSFEFFPPKDDSSEEQLWETIAELGQLEPTFVSVLALRGDPQGGPRAPWETHPGGMDHAIELVELAQAQGDLSVAVAAFPEGHPDAPDLDADADVLVAKARAGAQFAITQLFFRSADYQGLVERVRARDCDMPIIPGIMPILNYRQVSRMAELSGAEIPAEILEYIEPVADDPAEVRRRGIELATQLCREVLAAGAPGLHFITLNRSKASREIFESLRAEGLI